MIFMIRLIPFDLDLNFQLTLTVFDLKFKLELNQILFRSHKLGERLLEGRPLLQREFVQQALDRGKRLFKRGDGLRNEPAIPLPFDFNFQLAEPLSGKFQSQLGLFALVAS